MASESDARENETDHSKSEFGPPLQEFGPPVSEFGWPAAEFGPPVSDFGGPVEQGNAPQWEPDADHPELVWRPADKPETVPPPPPQYRAPDSTTYPDIPPRPPAPSPRREPGPTTVRHPTAPTADQDTWWNSPANAGDVLRPPTPARSSESPGLAWAEDPIAMRLALGVPAAAPPKSHSHRGRWIVLGLIAALAMIGALAITIFAVGRDGNGGGSAVAPPPGATIAALSCPASKDGKVTVGNGSGDTASGSGAILGFQNAFYVERSGERVRAFVAPDAENVSPAEVIQQAIDGQVPVGTTHCVRIAELATDTYEVDLTEHRPNGTTIVYRQTVTMVDREGRILIYAIRER